MPKKNIAFFAKILVLSFVFFPSSAFAAGASFGTPLSNFIFSVINVALYAFLIRYLYNKHGRAALKARALKIKEHLQRSKAQIGESQQKYDGLKSKLEGIELEKKELFKRYDEEGRNQSTLVVSNAKDSSTRLGADTEKQIDNELSRTSKKIREEVVSKASAKARKQLSSLSDSDDKALRKKVLEEFLKQETNMEGHSARQ